MKSSLPALSLIAVLSIFTASLPAQDYVGSAACGICHEDNFNSWSQSGHHLAMDSLTGAIPQFPFQYNPGTDNVPSPPFANGNQLDWNDISYLIGGYYWSANFCDDDGYLITGQTGEETEWNIWNQEWTAFHPGEQLSTDCMECHATGYDSSGHQGGLAGITGVWSEDGVGCEACHGPDS